MRNIVIIASLAAALALSGCGTISLPDIGGTDAVTPPPAGTPTLTKAQSIVMEARGGYDALVLAPVAAYHSLPSCSVAAGKVCSDPNIIGKVVNADAAVKIALDGAEKAAAANPTLDSTSLLSDVNVSVSVATQILVANKIGNASTIVLSTGNQDIDILLALPQIAGDSLDAVNMLAWANAAKNGTATQDELDQLHAMEATLRASLDN